VAIRHTRASEPPDVLPGREFKREYSTEPRLIAERRVATQALAVAEEYGTLTLAAIRPLEHRHGVNRLGPTLFEFIE
jgi:hypothetical protein